MRHRKNKAKAFIIILSFMAFFIISGLIIIKLDIVPHPSYSSSQLHIKTIKSKLDYDHDGIDDYTDMMLGARTYIRTKPHYKSGYYQGGYPPKGVGVCTDVIWEAFKSAGYSLKDMVDQDIADHPEAYKSTIQKPDPNIDFRRVKNLKIFFDRNAISLTLDTHDVSAWQPGDIVVYAQSHIAMISDKRNQSGRPYIIHNAGRPCEVDDLNWGQIVGHYRWKDFM